MAAHIRSYFDRPVLALVWRDLRRHLRSPVAAGMVALFVGGAAVMVVTQWPEDVDDAARMSRDITYLALAAAVLSAVAFLPGLAASSLVEERQRDTYLLLRLAPMDPWQIVLGKAGTTLAFYMLLLLAAWPVTAATFFLVGFASVEWLLLYLVALVPAFCATAAGVFCSSLARTPLGAMLGSYGTIVFLALFVRPSLARFSFRPEAVFTYLALPVAISAFLLYVASAREEVRDVYGPYVGGRKRGAPKARRSAVGRALDTPVWAFLPITRRWAAGHGNPILSLGLRVPLRRSWGLLEFLVIVFMGATGLIFAVLLLAFREFPPEEVFLTLAFIFGLSCAALAHLRVVDAISGERELGTLEWLRLSLLRPWEIAWAKLTALYFGIGLQILVCFTFMTVILTGVLLTHGAQLLSVVLVLPTFVVVCLWLSGCTGLFASATARSNASSLIRGLGLGLLLHAGGPLFCGVLALLSPHGPSPELFETVGLFLSPSGAVVLAIADDRPLLFAGSMVFFILAGAAFFFGATRLIGREHRRGGET